MPKIAPPQLETAVRTSCGSPSHIISENSLGMVLLGEVVGSGRGSGGAMGKDGDLMLTDVEVVKEGESKLFSSFC